MVGAFMLTGCATIFSGSSAKIPFETDGPDDTEFTITSVQTGERTVRKGNRFVVELKRNADYQVSVQAQGYKGQDVLVGRSFNMLTILNILFWPGLLVDFATGAMYQPDKERVYVRLEKAKSSGGNRVFPVVLESDSGRFNRKLEIPASAMEMPVISGSHGPMAAR